MDLYIFQIEPFTFVEGDILYSQYALPFFT